MVVNRGETAGPLSRIRLPSSSDASELNVNAQCATYIQHRPRRESSGLRTLAKARNRCPVSCAITVMGVSRMETARGRFRRGRRKLVELSHIQHCLRAAGRAELCPIDRHVSVSGSIVADGGLAGDETDTPDGQLL